VSEAILAIAGLSQEQSASTREVSAKAEEMRGNIDAMSSDAQMLAETAEGLRQLVARFKRAGRLVQLPAQQRRKAA
jgi:methyl-accepting chemotaxis protein